ncbi:hypothetical protein DSC_01960 [Pseudoxanthomonas spadix BD-a59]|uniref:Uncharacterized protein n=1 Tax=Pseudoxanthomonas spadix (strain BD-a59) TaxID=1045855 RepID=G7UUW6_PSEUP|nr:hypothetical protein DSC_01960 [Pseudoxanthomonas spadix BD-a59]
MAFQIEYFHPRLLAEIESWPVDVLADYAAWLSYWLSMAPAFACLTPGPSGMGYSS